MIEQNLIATFGGLDAFKRPPSKRTLKPRRNKTVFGPPPPPPPPPSGHFHAEHIRDDPTLGFVHAPPNPNRTFQVHQPAQSDSVGLTASITVDPSGIVTEAPEPFTWTIDQPWLAVSTQGQTALGWTISEITSHLPPDPSTITPLTPSKSNPEAAQTGLLIYCGLDATTTGQLAPILSSQFTPSTHLIYNFEKSLLAPTMDMMLYGIQVDAGLRLQTISELEEETKKNTYNLWQTVAQIGFQGKFSIASNDDLQDFLYGYLGITPVKTFTKGEEKISVGAPALKKIREANPSLEPFIDLILHTKDTQKLTSTLKMHLRRGRFHTSFNFATETGRWSSSKGVFGDGSNAQNLDPRFRRILIADPGQIFVYVDLSSAESVCVAYLADDLAYIKATTESDIHTYVAQLCNPELPWPSDPAEALIFAETTKLDNVDLRSLAKKGGHGSNYLGQPPTIAQHLKISTPVAEDFQISYFGAFPGIPRWHSEVIEALSRAYPAIPTLMTPFGRERQFFGRPDDPATHREAVANLPQSMTADSLNLGLLRVWQRLKSHGVQLLAQVHDAVLAQVPITKAAQLVPAIVETLQVEVPVRGRVMKIRADAEVGYNWGKHHPESNPAGMQKFDLTRIPEPPAALPRQPLTTISIPNLKELMR